MRRYVYLFLVFLMFSTASFSQDYKKAFEVSSLKLSNYINANHNGKIVGVLPFEADTPERSALLPDIYSYYLKLNNIKIVDRKELEKIIEEIKLSMAGIVDSKNSGKIGELSGADLLLTGNMSLLGDIYFVNVKLIDVATGETVFMDSINFEDKEFITIKRVEEYFAERKYPLTAAYRSAIMPGWGQFYNDQPIKGTLFMGSTFGGIGSTIYFFSEYNKYINKTSEGEELIRDQEMANKNFRYFTWSLGITLVVWLLNVVDAYLGAR